MGRPISETASTMREESERYLPLRSSNRRKIFSITTTAESTMMPKSMAPSEIRFAGMWRRSSSAKAPSSATGTASATTSAERQLPRPRNKISTSNTSAMPSITLCRTVCKVRSMRAVRS